MTDDDNNAIIGRADGAQFRVGDRIRHHDRVGTIKEIPPGQAADIYIWWDDMGDYNPTIALECINPWSIDHIGLLDELAEFDEERLR